MNLINLKSLDDFTLSGCKKIVETLGDGGVNAFNRVFKEGPEYFNIIAKMSWM